jgi:mRNA-degrading endonuclease toxin of MazEF toxin-antitoxin module
MSKDFGKWHPLKTKLHNVGIRPYFHEREVWWCVLGDNIGFEQDGKGNEFARPALILKKFNNEIFWALPLTTKIKKGKYYAPIDLADGVERMVILSQLRLIDAKRLRDKVYTLPKSGFIEIQKAVITLLQ